jgi:hypothetical protein
MLSGAQTQSADPSVFKIHQTASILLQSKGRQLESTRHARHERRTKTIGTRDASSTCVPSGNATYAPQRPQDSRAVRTGAVRRC